MRGVACGKRYQTQPIRLPPSSKPMCLSYPAGVMGVKTFVLFATPCRDHVDVKTPSHLMLAKLCAVAPLAVLSGAEKLVGPLEGTLTVRLKSDAVKQEVR